MADMKEIFKREIVYKANNIDNAKIQKNLVYHSANDKNLLMDLYTPCGKNESNTPVVILIHGEAKSINNMKDAGQYCSWGKLITVSGLSAVTFNHRVLSDGFSIEDVFCDIKNLINYVIDNSDDFKIDKNKMAILCFSGGAPFGLYTGMNSYFNQIKCIASYYGFGDFEYVNPFFNTSIKSEVIEKYSPIRLIQNKDSKLIPPILLLRAGIDNEMLNKSLDKFVTEALAHNLMIDVLNHPTGQHAFDIFNDNDRTHEIIYRTLDYLVMHLKNND